MVRRLPLVPTVAAAATFLIHLAGNPHYGFFRDELYFIACGRHPAFGYVDQPPLVPLIAAATQALGPSLLLLRAVAALFAAASVYVTCLIAAEFGGGVFAQAFAAAIAFFAPVLMNFGMKLSTDSVGLVAWPLAALIVTRIVQGQDPRLWLAAGASIGIALEAKYSALYFAAALVAGIALTSQRKVLASRWFAAGALVAAGIAALSVIWQAAHGFPIVELLRNGVTEKNLVASPLLYVVQQLLITNLFLAPVWIAGLWRLAADARSRYHAVAYVLLIAAMIASHGKHYYPADVYPIPIAAGAVALEGWTSRHALPLRSALCAYAAAAGLAFLPLAMPVLPETAFVSYENALLATLHISRQAAATEHNAQGALPQDWADMHGWPELARTVAGVYDSLPPADRAKAVAVAADYGQAAAIEFFAPRVPVVSGHNQYWLWGTRGYSGDVVIDVGGDCGARQHLFASAVRAAVFTAPWVMPYEDRLPIMVCRGIKVPLESIWPQIKLFI